MKAVLVESISLADNNPELDFCFCFSGSPDNEGCRSHFLVYEKARDFLSAPRAYTVLQIEVDTYHWLEFDADLVNVDFDEPVPRVGVYHLPDATESELSYCFISSDRAVAFSCRRLAEVKTIYHCVNAQEAMSQYLAERV